MELKKIYPLSAAKIAGLAGIIYGLIMGILFSVIIAKAGNVPEVATQLGTFSQLGYWAIAIFPIMYGILYFIVGIVSAFIYNLLARWVGGIKIELGK